MANWWETDPEITLSGYCTISFVATFTNNMGSNATFTTDTIQIWAAPSIADPPLTINSKPSGTVADGDPFSYDITIDVSGLDASDVKLGIRPNCDTFGTLGPGRSLLSSATITIQ